MYKPRVDPCIFLHGDPDAWILLLGEKFIGELIRRFRHVARDIDDLVRYSVENPGAVNIGLRGLEIGGHYRDEWMLFIESGYLSPGARTKWPYVQNDTSLDVRIQASPCYLLTSLDKPSRRYVWRNRASSLFHWISDIPRYKPLEVFRKAFPAQLRELAKRGYAWVAWSRWRDRHNKHLAEWLYWLDTGRMAHIDAILSRRCEMPYCTKNQGAEVLYVST